MNSKILDNVTLGPNPVIEDFCIIGALPRDAVGQDLTTVIGENAIIRSHTVIYAGNRIGHDFETGNKANIREYNTIGNHVSIGSLTSIEHHVKIGDHVRIHSNAFIPEYTVIEEYAWIGPHVVMTNARYPMARAERKELKGPIIRKNAKIGANSTILPGVEIGENALVGAGSVVTKDVPPDAVVAGNPAKIIRMAKDLPLSK